MKNRFALEYRCPNEKFKKAFEEGVFVLDTNVLLDLLRLNLEFRDVMLSLVERLIARIVIPHHVGEEYHKHYYDQFLARKAYIEKFQTRINDFRKERDALLEQYAFILPEDAKLTSLKDEDVCPELTSFFDQEMESLKQEVSTYELRNRIADLFKDRILVEFEETKEFFDDAEDRYNKKRPPGYLDADKTENRYGDLIIWKEILAYAEANKDKMIIFVSEDVKDDWVYNVKGMKVGPRKELIEEFAKMSDSNFYVCDLSTFIAHCHDWLDLIAAEQKDWCLLTLSKYKQMNKPKNSESTPPTDTTKKTPKKNITTESSEANDK